MCDLIKDIDRKYLMTNIYYETSTNGFFLKKNAKLYIVGSIKSYLYSTESFIRIK